MGALYKGLIATAVLSLLGDCRRHYQLIGFGPSGGRQAITGMRTVLLRRRSASSSPA